MAPRPPSSDQTRRSRSVETNQPSLDLSAHDEHCGPPSSVWRHQAVDLQNETIGTARRNRRLETTQRKASEFHRFSKAPDSNGGNRKNLPPPYGESQQASLVADRTSYTS